MIDNFKDDKVLSTIKDIIVRMASPEKVILFGSRAKGEICSNSDYDILIIKRNISNERHVTKKINRALYNENIDVPVDIIAIDEKKWNINKRKIGYIYSKINSEGIVIYE